MTPDAALRRLRNAVRSIARAEQRIDPAELCLELISGGGPAPLKALLSSLDGDEFDYAVASVYAMLMSPERRKQLGAYFTPPHLVAHVLSMLDSAGARLEASKVHDPAAGGAAFVVPLVRRIATRRRAEGVRPQAILKELRRSLSGAEIDGGLARVANALIVRALERLDIQVSAPLELVVKADSLKLTTRQADVIVGNPPYGRVGRLNQRIYAQSFPDVTGGQINQYALFLRRSLDLVSREGLICLVLPTSFLQGPEFTNLRKAIRARAEVVRIDLIDSRTGLFLDVVQDTCVLLLRRSADEVRGAGLARCQVLHADGRVEHLGSMACPADGGPWLLPTPGLPAGGETLADYGYRCSVGYLVRNRQRDRLSGMDENGRYPLVQAASIRPDGRFILSTQKPCFVKADAQSRYIVRSPCVAIQRTANKKQSRRINAAAVPSEVLDEFDGLVGENHVIFVHAVGSPRVPPESLARLLNSRPVNQRWSAMSGTISLSSKLLAALDLPCAGLVSELASIDPSCVDHVVSWAYEESSQRREPTFSK
jgi:adenine-specific DNA-methyltransferase